LKETDVTFVAFRKFDHSSYSFGNSYNCVMRGLLVAVFDLI